MSPRPEPRAPLDVAVIGGGASGMVAAIRAARLGRSVVLLERSPSLGEGEISHASSVRAGDIAVHKVIAHCLPG